MSCSHNPDGLCEYCGSAGHPPIGTPAYALRRKHPDAGDLDALRQMTDWLRTSHPFCHLRFADGEFNAILGHTGVNGDNVLVESPGLGRTLDQVLTHIAENPRRSNLLVGVDWDGADERLAYLKRYNLLARIPWCPSQVFVNGIVTDDTLRFLQALREHPGRRFLVANAAVCAAVARGLDAEPLVVRPQNAWEDVPGLWPCIDAKLRAGDTVLYCAGMASEPLAYSLWLKHTQTTHIDMGCLFDGLAGLCSRTWLELGGPRVEAMETRYAAWLKCRRE